VAKITFLSPGNNIYALIFYQYTRNFCSAHSGKVWEQA